MRITMKVRACLFAGAASLSVACELPTAHRNSQLFAGAPGVLRSTAFGFRMPAPPMMTLDSLGEQFFNGPIAIPMAQEWAFNRPSHGKGDTLAYRQRVVINAFHGIGVNEAEWNRFAAAMTQGLRTQMPGGSVVENVVRWRPDIAELRFAIHDSTKGEFYNVRCLGTQVGRPKPGIVCVQTSAPTADTFAAVREGLVLTPEQTTTAGK